MTRAAEMRCCGQVRMEWLEEVGDAQSRDVYFLIC